MSKGEWYMRNERKGVVYRLASQKLYRGVNMREKCITCHSDAS